MNRYIIKLLVCVLALQSVLYLPIHEAEAAAISRAPNNLGLQGYWSFDEGTGTTVGDSSGNGYTGTLTNMDPSSDWTSGKRGKALDFDGVDDYMNLGRPGTIRNLTRNVTMSAWIKRSPAGRLMYILASSRTTTANGMALSVNSNGRLRFTTYTVHDYDSSYDLPINEWVHVAVVMDASYTVLFYVNGKYVDQAGHNAPGGANADDDIYIGAGTAIGSSVPNNFFQGQIDEVRVYSRALSASEMAAMYQSATVKAKAPSNTGLLGYWSFNEGRGNKAGDSSGYGNTGTLTNVDTALDWVTGKRGKGLNFDGVNDYVEIADTDSLTPSRVSISTWIKWDGIRYSPASSLDWSALVAKGGYHAGEYTILFSRTNASTANELRFYLNGNLVANWLNASGTDTNWHHIVTTYDGSRARIYYDGIEVGAGNYTSSLNNTTQPVNIGRQSSGTSYPFGGKLDEVRIYNRVLSAQEIAGLAQAGAVTVNASQNNRITDGLVGLWSFNGQDMDRASTTAEVLDRSGNNRRGDAVGAKPAIGKVGQALSFNGTSDYVAGGGFSESGIANQPFSFTGWVKINRGAGNGNIIHLAGQSNGRGWCLPPVAYSEGKLRGMSWNTGPVFVNGTTVLDSDAWYHFALTWDAANGLRLFVNGALENSIPMASYGASGVNNYLFLGYNPGICSGTLGMLNGALDEVRVYNRALSAGEVKQLYDMGK